MKMAELNKLLLLDHLLKHEETALLPLGGSPESQPDRQGTEDFISDGLDIHACLQGEVDDGAVAVSHVDA